MFLPLCNSFAQEFKVEGKPKVIKVDPKSTNVSSMLDLFEIQKIIPLETKEESLLGTVFEICKSKSRFFLYQRFEKTILIFDEDGRFINKAGSNGKGPGEFLYPTDITTFQNELYVLDNYQGRIFVYDLDGRYHRSINLSVNASYFEIINENLIALHNNFSPNRGMYFLNYFVDGKGKLLDKVLPFLEIKRNTNRSLLSHYTKFRDEIYFRSTYNDTIYQIYPDHVEQKYVMDFGEFSIPTNFFEEYTGNKRFIRDKLKNNIQGIQSFHVADNSMIFTYTFGRSWITSVFDRDSEELLQYKRSNTNDFFNWLKPFYVQNDLIYSLVNPIVLERNKERLKRNKDEYPQEVVNKFSSLIENLDLNANPYIVVSKLKH